MQVKSGFIAELHTQLELEANAMICTRWISPTPNPMS